jgi:hypothetical protein
VYDLPASHLNVHATIEQGLPGSKVFLQIYFALDGAYFALCSILFLQLHGLVDEQYT